MKTCVRNTVAATTLAVALAVPAHAAPLRGGPLGRACGFESATDVTREGGWQTGVLSAGPLVTLEDGVLRCSIHLGNSTHDGAAALTVSVGTVAGVAAVLAPQALDFQVTSADDVSVCSEWDGAGATQYWVGGDPTTGALGHWDTNASSSCGATRTVCVTGVPDQGSELCAWLAESGPSV